MHAGTYESLVMPNEKLVKFCFRSMLSIENSSDPSCSSKKASSDLVCAHDDHAHPSNFSIRDYVFKSRSKDIRINWPFREQQLKVCLDNGIVDLLPPLEHPNLVRACRFKGILDINGEHKESVVVNLDQDLVPSSTKVSSERMASNVCKTFSLSSNTTLNAHIDQCLSSDKPDAIDAGNGFSKPKAKPRKKRMMVDIYETAPHCTLEDLDRRNGTNWAASLNLAVAPAPINETNLEIKRKKVSVSDAGSEVNEMDLECKRKKSLALDAVSEGNVGDIYVDLNGTKLLILSKFDDSNQSVMRKNFKLKKHGNGLKAGPSCEITKKKILKPKCSMFMKDIPENRKLIMDEGFDGEEAETEEVAQACQNEHESVSQLLNAHGQVKNREPSTLGHWVCSKRSDLSRKFNDEIINKRLALSKQISFRCTQTDTGSSSSERTRASVLQSLSEAMAAPKTKKIVSPQPSNLKSNLLLEGDSFANSRMPKLSSSNESRRPSLKARKSLKNTVKNAFPRRKCISLEGMEANKHEILIPRKKFKKQRSNLGCSNWREGEKHSDINGGSHSYNEDFGLVSAEAKETSESHQSNISDNQGKGTNLDSTHEEHAVSVYGNEIQAELLDQRPTYIREEQSVDTISNDVRITSDQDEQMVHFRESPTDTTNDGDMSLENTQETTSASSATLKYGQDHNIIVDMESSGSAVSTTTIMDDKIEDAIKAKPSPNARRPSCSCSESLSRESQFSSLNRKIMASNLFIKPQASPLSSQGFHSLESPTDSAVTMDSPKSAANISQPHPGPNPILRLMGKDLVVSKQESMSSEPKLISFGIPENVGFTSYRNPHQFQAMGSQQIPIQTLQIPDKLNSPSHYSMGRTRPIIPSYRVRDMIVIDDDSHGLEAQPRTNFTAVPRQYVQSSNMLGPQRLFACFPSQNPYASRAFATNGYVIYPSNSPSYFSPIP